MTVPLIYIEALLPAAGLTDDQTTYLDTVIAMAESHVEDALPGFSFATGTATDEVVHNGDPDVLWTSHYPVTALTTVTRDGAVLSTSSLTWTDKGRLTLGTQSMLNEFEVAPWIFGSGGVYKVTHAYGYATIPVDLCAEVARLVVAATTQQTTNPDGIEAESLGAYSVTYGRNPVALGFPPVSYEVCRRWSRNRQVSVPLARYR